MTFDTARNMTRVKQTRQSNPIGWMIFLFLLLLLPNLATLLFCTEFTLFKRLAALCFAIIIWMLPAMFLRAKSYFLLMSLFMLPAPVEIGCAYIKKIPLNEGLISSIVCTHASEAIELTSQFFGFIPFILLVWAVYYYIVWKKISNVPIFPVRYRKIGILIFLLFNVGLWGSMYYITSMHRPDRWGAINATNDNFWKKYQIVYPCNIVYSSYQIESKRRLINRMHKELHTFHFNAHREQSVAEPEVYVLIIGESARYDHFGINGYERQTTPLLSQTPNLLSYSDVYATANLTEYAIPLLLSRATPHTIDRQYKEKALPDLFKEAGFSTYWIANQGSTYPFVQRIVKETDGHYFLATLPNSSGGQDDQLLPYLDEFLDKDDPKQFIVIHTYGSHFQFDMRYPESFTRFKPHLSKEMMLDGSAKCKERLINSYDNTILFTDYFISQVIQRLQQKNKTSLLIYVSDHAESLYDPPTHRVLHGNTRPETVEIHIPLLLWYSDSYQEHFPEKVCSLKQNIDKRLSSTNLFDTFTDIAGIRYPNESLEQSFASPFFKEDSLRYLLTPEQQVISKR